MCCGSTDRAMTRNSQSIERKRKAGIALTEEDVDVKAKVRKKLIASVMGGKVSNKSEKGVGGSNDSGAASAKTTSAKFLPSVAVLKIHIGQRKEEETRGCHWCGAKFHQGIQGRN